MHPNQISPYDEENEVIEVKDGLGSQEFIEKTNDNTKMNYNPSSVL